MADEAASIYNLNCQYMARVTPEMLDAQTYNIETGEWRQVADDYQRLEARALRLYLDIPESQRDFYRQLVLFPVQAMANLYDMYYAQAMNRYLAAKGDPDANDWAAKVSQCFRRDSLLCLGYNRDIAGGKWNGMMIQKHIGYTNWNDNFPKDMQPKTTTVPAGSPTGYTFPAAPGYLAIEAEHYYRATAPEGTQWSVYPNYGRTRSAMALTPYARETGDAALVYRFALPADVKQVKVRVVVKSTLDFMDRGGHEYTVSLDGQEEQVVNFNKTLVDRQPYQYSVFYPTIARRVVESVVDLPVASQVDYHELTLHPRHGGIVFEKIVIDYGGYSSQYLFGEESPVERKQ